MKSLLTVMALGFAVAFTAPAFAQQPEPKTQAECVKADRQWDEGGKICLPRK